MDHVTQKSFWSRLARTLARTVLAAAASFWLLACCVDCEKLESRAGQWFSLDKKEGNTHAGKLVVTSALVEGEDFPKHSNFSILSGSTHDFMVDRPTYVTKLPVELSSIRVIPDSTAEAFIVAPGRIRVRGKSEGPAVIHIKGRRNSETAEYIEDSFEVDVLRPTKIELEHDCEDPTYVAGLAALLPYDLQTSQGTVRGEQLYPVRVEPEGAARIIPKSSDHEVLALSFAEDAREVELRSTVVEQEHPYLLTLEPKQIDQLDGFALVQGGTAKRLPWISFSFGEPFVVDTLAVIDGRPQCAMHVPTKLTVATGGCEVLFGTGEWKKEERYSPVGRFVLRNDGGSGSSCTLELAVVGAAAAMVSEDASPYLEIEAREQGRPSPSPSSSSSSFDFD